MVAVIDFLWWPGETKYHNTFKIMETETGVLYNDDLEFHFLELPKIRKMNGNIANPLERWMMYLNNVEGKALEEIAMQDAAIKKALRIEELFWMDEKEKRMYFLREKGRMENEHFLQESLREAKAEAELETQQNNICRILQKKFPDSYELQIKIKLINSGEALAEVLDGIVFAVSQDEAAAIVSKALDEQT
jgi:predicted transposase/invertase (TIGR01784 family)